MKVNPETQQKITKVASLLKGCRSILFITGAGISADSGLPTYRGIGGLYNNKTTDDGIPIEMALAGEMLQTQPAITWKYLAQIEQRCRGATFNRAHEVIVEMEKSFPRVWVLTQNIDGFHNQAGSQNVIDIHGDMHKLLCPKCAWRTTIKDYSGLKIPPLCPVCNNVVRPDVVFFGEQLPYDKLELLFSELHRGFDIYFSVGTTSVFPYIQRPIEEAKYTNRPSIEINPAKTGVSHLVDVKLPSGAAETLNAIWQIFQSSVR